MNIVTIDDYQDAVRKLHFASKFEVFPANVYSSAIKTTGKLSLRLRAVEGAAFDNVASYIKGTPPTRNVNPGAPQVCR